MGQTIQEMQKTPEEAMKGFSVFKRGMARKCHRGSQGTGPHLLTVLQEVLLLSVVPKAS